MAAPDLTTLTVSAARDGLRSGTWTSEELTTGYLARIRSVDPSVHAFLHVADELALAKAAEADRIRAEGHGEPSPLLGVPLAVKDVLSTQEMDTTCGSRILKGYRPPFTATAVERLQAAGSVLLGKTNTD